MANPLDMKLVAEVSEELADSVVDQFLSDLYELQFIDRRLTSGNVEDELVIKISDALDEIAFAVVGTTRGRLPY